MSKLESIVPPLELCKQIPAGELEESVLVWAFDHQKARKYFPETNEDDRFFYVENREFVEDTIMSFAKCGVGNWINRPPMISAPTLAEIMAKLPPATILMMDATDVWVAIAFYGNPGVKIVKESTPEAAALRMWLRIRRAETKTPRPAAPGGASEGVSDARTP